MAVLALCAANLVFTGSVHLALGNHRFAFAMLGVLPLTAIFALALRIDRSVGPISHLTVVGLYTVSLFVALATHGQVAGGLFVLVLVPAVAILIIGRRAGIAWALVTCATLVGLTTSGGFLGIEPWLELDPEAARRANLRAAGLVILAVTAMTYFFSAVHQDARDALQRLVGRHRQGERRFRAITEHAYDLIAEVDLEGRFVFASPGFEEALGWLPHEMIGQPAGDRIHPDDLPRAHASWQVLLEKGRVQLAPIRLISAEGHERWFQISMRAYAWREDATRVVTVARDVTEQLDHEQVLRRQQRLVTGGTMAAGLAHQLNNPLGAILAAAQFANRYRWSPDFGNLAGDSLDAIEEEAERSGRILRSMLAYSREEQSEHWVEDLKDTLHRAVRAVRIEEADSDVEIVTSIVRDPAPVRMSPIEIEQVVVNLIRNAIEAGAQVVVVGLVVSTRRTVQVTISDDGPGLGDLSAEDAFSAFTTTRPGQGSGLGLAVAREIVASHGGWVDLVRTGPEGAIFRFELPLAEAEAEESEESTSA